MDWELGGGGLNKIPEGWANVFLSDVAQWGSGGTPSRANSAYYGGSVPWVKTGELGQGFIKNTKEKITELGLQNSSAKIKPTGSVLVAMYGATIGKTAILGIEAATNQACAAGTPLENITTTKYLFYYLSSQRDAFLEAGRGGAQPNISLKVIKSWPIPLAPFKQQKRITDKLDSLLVQVNACRNRFNQVPLILKHFRQSVLSSATSGDLTKDWRNGEDTRSWLYGRADDVCEKVQSGGTPKEGFVSETGIPFLKVYNIVDQKIDFEYRSQFVLKTVHEGILAKSCALPNDVLINIVGPPLGKVAIVPNYFPEWNINQAITIFRPSEKITSKWLYYLLCSGNNIADIIHETRGSAGQSNISLSQCRNFVFPVPSVKEQQEIVRRIEILFGCADCIEAHYRNAYEQVEKIVPTLLNKAFQGKLVPQDPTDEPASILVERINAEKIRLASEQKTTHTVKQLNKKNAPIIMKKSSDYSDALRLAFGKLSSLADARQLFDRAGFKAEETVQFYEALREIPEVRAAFERPEQVQLSQSQSLIETIIEKPSAAQGRFRLIELWLEDFKNLSDYTVRFDPSHSIDVVLGWNGTGKSNLFEALVIIFRDLHRWWEKNRWTQKPMKGYRLRYAINNEIVEIFWQPSEMKRPKLMAGKILEGNKQPEKLENIKREKLLLPRFIFGYYSGPTNRLAEHFLPMKQDHYDQLLDATSDDPDTLNLLLEQRRFFCAENHHAKYVLLAFFHKQDEKIDQFLEERLRIIGFESALFIIRKPRWAKDTAENFWGADGIMRRVLERLRRFAIAPMLIKQTIPDGFRSSKEEHYYFFLPDLQSLHAFAAEYQDARTFFLALESIDFSELIYDVKIQVRVKATETEQVGIAFHELSEGEQQLLMVLGLMRFTKSNQSLVLLDEPDTHLNPHWSVDYLKLLAQVMSEDSSESEAQQTSQILMSTHDPLVIASLFKEQIHLLKRDWRTGVCQWGQPSINPRGLGFTGILTSEMFGMRSDLDEETLADLDSKVRIIAREGSLTPKEEEELEKINQRLEDAGFQKAFSDPYYAAFIRAWSQRHSDLMAGMQFVDPEKQAEIDRIAREVLKEAIAELEMEAIK
jgi:restriction endonuclease S subunit/predicted ATPase